MWKIEQNTKHCNWITQTTARISSFLTSKILTKFEWGQPVGAMNAGEVGSNWQLWTNNWL